MAEVGNCKMDRRESNGEVVGTGLSNILITTAEFYPGAPLNVATLLSVRKNSRWCFYLTDY